MATQTIQNADYDKEFSECIEVFYVFDKNNKKLKYVKCKTCVALPNIVKLNSGNNNKLAPLATAGGCRYRKKYVAEHFQSKYHKACKMAIDTPSNSKGSIDIHFSKADSKMILHLKKLLFEVYADGKKLTNSAFSWPSRFVASEAGRSFDYENVSAPTISPSLNLQYVNPNSYAALLSAIVMADKPNLQRKLETAIACSIRVDGSVDRAQIDKIYVMLKIITAEGDVELIFLGIGEQTERGAIGLFQAVKKAIIENVGEDMYKIIMKSISSICTDGTNVNSGDKGGLWKLFEDEIRKIGSSLPFTKIWCSAHRMELAWGDVCNAHRTINTVLKEISSLSSYFHKSGLRTSALKQIAAEKELHLSVLPKLFTIRWTQYSFAIVNSLLRSWRALMTYFDEDEAAESKGYFKFLSKMENLQMICFLADLLHIFSRHQKKVQADNLTFVSLIRNINSLRSALINIQNEKILGGWEETLNNDIEEDDEKMMLNGFELTDSTETRRPTKNNFDSIRSSIIASIIECISERFENDEQLVNIIEPFQTFTKNADLRKIHDTFGSDLDLTSLKLQFDELVDQNIAVKFENNIGDIIKALTKNANYREIMTVLSRIYIATPHSADCERCISANNRIKTPLRNRISLETEIKYLYVHFNMPTLEQWEPRPTIKYWMNEKERRDRSNTIENKAKQAPHFKGIFEVACEFEPDEDNVEVIITNKKF